MNNSNTHSLQKKKKPGKATAFFICLVIASALWVLQALNTVYTYTIKLPVTFKNLPQNKKPYTQIPNHLSVDIKASGLKILLVLANQPFTPLEIDFNVLKSINKQQNYILTAGTINFKTSLKFETQIKRISPDTLYFSEKNGYQKNVRVKVPLFIKCAQGYGFKPPIITPEFITIWGDTTVINKIDTIYSQPLNLININKSYHTNLVIIKPNNYISISNGEVGVSINVDKLIEHSITLPITAINNKNYQQINLFPTKATIKFTSMQNYFNLNDTNLFRASINPTKINANNKCVITLTSIPSNVTILSIEPKDVEILIIKNN